ncbi:MAG: hypothetical protein ACLP36_09030 [Acidimicrobiales bacterium]
MTGREGVADRPRSHLSLVRAQCALAIPACAIVAIAVAVPLGSPASAARTASGPRAGGSYSSRLDAPNGARLPFPGSEQAVCGKPGVGVGQCLVHVLKPSEATSEGTVTAPTGLPPSTIEGVYGFTAASSAGAGQTIALVDAYNDPDAASDLDTFSAQYGLPLECTGGSLPPSCVDFTQLSQFGGSTLPATNSNWDIEISLDIEWAHSLAPAASILLVEATNATLSNLLAAEQYAAEHANYVSNSWGTSEFGGEASDDSDFTQPGVSYFVATGDTGGALLWPSTSPDVISVGGTSLSFTSGGTLAKETAWSDGGGGCSNYETASVYQSSGSVSCAGMRATPDLSLDADPNSGVSVYDSVSYEGQTGWFTVGGTSASTAMVAAEAAVTGTEVNAKYVYANPANIPFRDITSGSNGYPALPGYDLASGLGAWSYTPGAPSGLSATGVSGGVTLGWGAPSGAPVSDYTIWRGTAPGEESTAIATVNAPTTTYTDSSGAAGVTYYYEVQAANGLGVGSFSNEATAAPGKGPQTIGFTVPASGSVGGSANLSATGGLSGEPVAFSVDPSTESGTCNVPGAYGSTVNFTAVGPCVLDANESGSSNYLAAPTVTETIAVGLGSMTISFAAPASGSVGGSATLTPTGGPSSNPVVLSVAPSTTNSACSLNGYTVNYLNVGTCVIDANQAGNGKYAAAAQVQQTIAVGS